ncbi:MAG: monovalent cation:proton antiporter-2 (CPA2) family protein [Gammaproteobacteria bacterium]
MLEQIAIFLAATVLIVPLFKGLGLGTVLGYLIAGMLIGPWGLELVSDVENTLHFSELGVVLLLFVIGLELQPSRLWVLRRTVFGLGSAQLLLSALPIALLAAAMGQGWLAAVVIGVGAAMSSTAFVLQTLAERGELTTRHGRDSFAILLFQDLAVIPVLAIVPLLAVGPELSQKGVDWSGIMRALAVIVAMVVVGRQLLRLAFRSVARFGTREIFTAAALLVVVGTALLMHTLGLSMSLGAFLAGVLLADSEFRHEIEAELEPFKGLLLGLFFIAVGMSVNLGLIGKQGLLLIGLATALILIKFAVLYLIAGLAGGGRDAARNLGIALAAGGEFAFVLFSLARDHRIVAAETAETLVMVITLAMVLAPVLFLINDKLLKPWAARHEEPEYDRIDEPANPAVIAGFGRFGQIIARILRMRGIAFTALEISQPQVDFVRKFGSKIYYGDASRLELLRAAKVENTKLFVLAIDNIETSIKIAIVLRKHLPRVPIYARARNRFHCHKLMDLNVEVLYRDTYLSSLEMAREVLCGLGVARAEGERTVRMFRDYDEALLKRQHAIYHDETALIQSAKQAADELRSLFESDAAEPIGQAKAPATAS